MMRSGQIGRLEPRSSSPIGGLVLRHWVLLVAVDAATTIGHSSLPPPSLDAGVFLATHVGEKEREREGCKEIEMSSPYVFFFF